MGETSSVCGSNFDEENACEHYSPGNDDKNIDPHEVLFRLMYNREKPRNGFQKFLWKLSNCCLCCYTFCCPPCPPCIIHKMAFAPPKPTYSFVAFGDSKNNDYRIRLSRDAKALLTLVYPSTQLMPTMIRGFYVDCGSKRNRLACLYCRPIWSEAPNRKTILLSHSNAEDIGLMIGQISNICNRISVDLVVYDYSGYGRSGGCCSENRIYENIDCVYEFMIKNMKIPWKQIVAVGTSLGTAATIHLASRHQLGAVVLQGSFMSALRTLCPDNDGDTVCICMDRFVNLDKIHKVKCPTLFIHGENDKMFGVVHVKKLRSRCPGALNVEPLIIEGGEHVGFDGFEEYWQRFREFLQELDPQSASRKIGKTPKKKRSKSRKRVRPSCVDCADTSK